MIQMAKSIKPTFGLFNLLPYLIAVQRHYITKVGNLKLLCDFMSSKGKTRY